MTHINWQYSDLKPKERNKPVKPATPDQVIYVLFEKLLDINFERVAGIYATVELANEMLEEHWELFGRERTYRIELMTLDTNKAQGKE